MTNLFMKPDRFLGLVLLAPSLAAAESHKPKMATEMPAGITAPAGQENNWVQTDPGRGYSVIFRLYGPLDPWFDKTWRPSEIELVK